MLRKAEDTWATCITTYGVVPDAPQYNAMISAYEKFIGVTGADNGYVAKAEKVFEEMRAKLPLRERQT